MTEIVLCCGKVSCGKSTFARKLEAAHGYFPFSADEWMLHFYGEPPEREVFEQQLARCKEMIYRMAERLLARGVNVVLDFGFWKKAERRAIQERFTAAGFATRLVYFPIDQAQQITWLEQRQLGSGREHFRFDIETVDILNGMFEPPSGDEVFMLPDGYLAA